MSAAALVLAACNGATPPPRPPFIQEPIATVPAKPGDGGIAPKVEPQPIATSAPAKPGDGGIAPKVEPKPIATSAPRELSRPTAAPVATAAPKSVEPPKPVAGLPPGPQPTPALPRPSPVQPNQPQPPAPGVVADSRAPIPPTPASRDSVQPLHYPTVAPKYPPDNQFQDYGVNPFVFAQREKFSTFGLDVDTASYNIAKRYIREGALPPYQSVRVEEYVNAFRQGYGQPRESGFAVFADGAMSPFHSDGSVLMRVGVQGYRVPVSARKPASYVFVVDESGSMATENRIELAKSAVRAIVAGLGEGDSVAIVAFTTSSRVALEPTPAENRNAIERALGSIYPKNSTNLQSGLTLGYQQANRSFKQGGNNRIVLISDGVANEGGIRPDAILAGVQEYARRGIALTAIGVGFGNYNDVLMEQLADKSEGGNYVYLNNDDDVARTVAAKMGALMTIARDAKIQVEFNPDAVSEFRLIGYENRAIAKQDFRNDALKGGGLSSGHTSTAIYQVRLRPAAHGRVATVNLRWNDPDTNQTKEIAGNVNVGDLVGRFDQAAPRFQLAAVVAQAAEVLRRSPYAERRTLYELADRASGLAEQLSDDADVVEFAQLLAKAARLRS